MKHFIILCLNRVMLCFYREVKNNPAGDPTDPKFLLKANAISNWDNYNCKFFEPRFKFVAKLAKWRYKRGWLRLQTPAHGRQLQDWKRKRIQELTHER